MASSRAICPGNWAHESLTFYFIFIFLYFIFSITTYPLFYALFHFHLPLSSPHCCPRSWVFTLFLFSLNWKLCQKSNASKLDELELKSWFYGWDMALRKSTWSCMRSHIIESEHSKVTQEGWFGLWEPALWLRNWAWKEIIRMWVIRQPPPSLAVSFDQRTLHMQVTGSPLLLTLDFPL